MLPVLDFIHANRDRHISELKSYLAIPSISALPVHQPDVRRCAEWTADHMRHIGLENVRLIETPGNPVVYGDWLHAAANGVGAPAPTMLFYGHYDVQPVDPVELWDSPPFEATVRDGEIYARGAADDKGQVFMHLKAIEAHLAKTGRLPVNIKVIIEGEEEIGSDHLDDFIKANKPSLAADVVVISDSAMFDRGVPSICYSLRGLVYFQIDLRGTASDLHSGVFGGAVANPAMALSQVLAQMKDRSGRIKIPGFYDDVLALSDEERAEWKKLPFSEKKYRKELGAPKLFGESGYTTLERVWGRPTFEVNGLLSGFTGEGAKTVIPAVAMAKVSMRLVPNQHPDKIAPLFEAYLKKISPKTVDLKVTRMHGGKPWITGFDSPYVRAAGRAIEQGFGKAPVFCREGGSIPVVSTFQEELGIPAVLFGVGLPDENAHAPNERLDLDNFHNGIVASAILYDEFAKMTSEVIHTKNVSGDVL
jgi:acetylornithine deacetylase/succinyl-diaminopimelate desuccinylase-like protein